MQWASPPTCSQATQGTFPLRSFLQPEPTPRLAGQKGQEVKELPHLSGATQGRLSCWSGGGAAGGRLGDTLQALTSQPCSLGEMQTEKFS